MAISTVITSAAYTKNSPITFGITFGSPISDVTFARTDLVVTNGSVISLSGTGANWSAVVSPTTNNSEVSLKLPANSVADGTPNPNSVSNTMVVGFNSMKPRSVITHTISPITNSAFLNMTVTFERSVTGFTTSDLDLSNCSVHSLTAVPGSVTSYKLVVKPNRVGEVVIFVKAGAGTDVYGNTSAKSNEVVLEFDPASMTDKSDIMEGSVNDPDVLVDFTIDDLSQVAAINTLADCAKDLPQRLLDMATKKAFDLLLKNPNVQKLAGAVMLAQAKIETISAITETVQSFIEEPETLMAALLGLAGLSGEALRQKKQAIADQFGAITGIDAIINNVMASGVCGQPDYYADGSSVPKQILTPTNMTPPVVPGVSTGAVSTYNSSAKDAYDEFAFKLKESLEIDNVSEQDPDRACMISVITTLAMSYHDDVSKTIDDSKDDELYTKYKTNVAAEGQNNLGWSATIKKVFDDRTNVIGMNIARNTQVIRNFYNRNSVIEGALLGVGVTTYSGPADDFTTFLDIKPSQRPAALTAKYQAQGKRIPTGDTYTNSKGKTIKIGTLDYADAFNGAYGKIVSDMTCASTRVPGGSVLAMRNADGTAYDPSGKNPSGHYTVMDTGNAELTYKKPDIFTTTPNIYTNTGSVKVYLVSRGNQMKSQYKLAQSQYGGGNTA